MCVYVRCVWGGREVMCIVCVCEVCGGDRGCVHCVCGERGCVHCVHSQKSTGPFQAVG